jgi:hypothetical protein
MGFCLICSVPFRDKAPGQRECDYSIDGINRCIRDIEQASLAAVSQSLATRDDISVEVGWGSVGNSRGNGTKCLRLESDNGQLSLWNR